jgi:glycerophosphoryl diester phosphodiesterase
LFSLKASKCGADAVEFDVVVSKDLIPILSHDFEAKDWRKPEPEVVDINKLKLVELQSGKTLNLSPRHSRNKLRH